MRDVKHSDVTVICSFRNRSESLLKMLGSAHGTCPKEVSFCLVDAGSSTNNLEKLREFVTKDLDSRTVRICESAHRTSICEAWNLGMFLANTRYVIFVSSDVEFRSGGWVEEILCWLRGGKEYILLDNHAVFGFDKAAIPKMGWFDEGFGNGAHFDCDFMIRASEANIQLQCSQNYNYYHHADSSEETRDRLTKECKDRLPMNDFGNEDYFRRKWQSNWEGWRPSIEQGIYQPLPHPPTHISQVKRTSSEIDDHPGWTKRIKEMYDA